MEAEYSQYSPGTTRNDLEDWHRLYRGLKKPAKHVSALLGLISTQCNGCFITKLLSMTVAYIFISLWRDFKYITFPFSENKADANCSYVKH